ncbi:MAG: hypothetical protein LBC14_01505 [Desulfovibrio sp.]|jgi:hypothetical protein|nr:hypothetical protein [Desulfovibrio sp.]
MKSGLILDVFLLPVFLMCSFSAAFAAETLCTDGELLIFTCRTPKKTASVCASPQFGPDTGYLQYRFGEPGKIELTLPSVKAPPAKSAQSGTWFFSGGGGAYLRFTGEDSTDYFVYTAIGKWGKNGTTTDVAGISVQKDGKAFLNIKCRKPLVEGELGPDFFDKAGLPVVEKAFDLPD